MTLAKPRPRPGDLIEIPRFIYAHWAIYVGNGYVVHLTPPSEIAGARLAFILCLLADSAIVKKELLSVVAAEDKYRINNKHDDKYEPLPPNEIIRQAEERVGKEIHYSRISKNCEHFVNVLRYGVSRSDQVTNTVMALVVAAFVLAVVIVFRSLLAKARCHLNGISEHGGI